MTDATPTPCPLPAPDDVSEFFWEGARKRRLLLQRCSSCSLLQYPPDVICINCQSPRLEPTEASGRGTLYSYTVVERAFHVGFVDALPYVVALIELDDQPGLKMLSNVVGIAPRDLRVGMPLAVRFETRGDMVLPVFGPRAGSQ